MKTTIKTMKEAKKVCLELWEHIENQYGDKKRKVNVAEIKGDYLLLMGYEDINYNCPMCEAVEWCCECPLNTCTKNGFDDDMTGYKIKKFNAFVKERLI